MEVGDIVVPKDIDHCLRSGCGAYDFAVVIRLDPFEMVSEYGDMKWVTKDPGNYKSIGIANDELMNVVMRRY